MNSAMRTQQWNPTDVIDDVARPSPFAEAFWQWHMLGDPGGGTQLVMGCGATWSDVAATSSSEAKKVR